MPIGFWAISRRDIEEWYRDLYGKEIDRHLLDNIVNLLPFILQRALEDFVLPKFSGVK